ncbi:MAG: amidohydrolase family protein [Thermoproteota archaeon]|nr:amidohydrolase family protein [Thermoproteota archaeon]
MENSCDLLITNGLIVIPTQGVVDTNVLVEDGKIKAIRKSIDNVHASRVVNAAKKYVLPGIIDPHVHYGVFTPLDSSATAESRSAAIGGITTMIRMLRMHGSYRNILKHLEVSRRAHIVDYRIHASIMDQRQIKEMPFLSKLGINSFKIYMNLGSDFHRILADLEPGRSNLDEMKVNMTDDVVFEILKKGVALGSVLLVHAEDHVECSMRMRELNKMSKFEHSRILEIWSNARPTSSEVTSIYKITKMASTYGARIYFVHIGSADALQAIVKSRDMYKNLSIWTETCPHYLTHTTEYNKIIGKVVPPIRSKSDVLMLWHAIKNGQIDTMGTDHVANKLKMKVVDDDLWESLAGFPGVATMLPVMLSEGVNKNRISLERLSEVCSYNTARIFGMYPKKGTIKCGSDADLTIVDMEKEQVVTPDLLQSYSDYTIYDGWKLRGWPTMTIVRGRMVMENGHVDPLAIGYGGPVTIEGT